MMKMFLHISFFLSFAGFGCGAVPEEIQSILQRSCLNCHSTEKQKGDLDLESSDIQKDPEVWEHVLEQIASGEMPPKKEKPLPTADRNALTTWVRDTLDGIALANAGDPGPVLLRRLSNVEYTYTIRDLTGVDSLDPAEEFPVDGAAGEGFTNVGAALVMSPALITKYLDAAREVAGHAVFTPRGMHWSASDSSRDWTNEAMDKIRAIYAKYTVAAGSVDLKVAGAKIVDEALGRLPLASYLDALQGRGSAVGLNPKYLRILGEALASDAPSVLLDPLREKYRQRTLTAGDIEPWQRALWRFASVGHIGKEGGPKAWQEPITPLADESEIRVPLSGEGDMSLYLTTTGAGDGTDGDEVIWENPRIVAPGFPDLPVSDLPALVDHLEKARVEIISSAEDCLNAIAEGRSDGDAVMLTAWREYLGFGTTKLEHLLSQKILSTPDYNFIKGWKGENALSVMANASDNTVRIPGEMRAHSVATHPSPDLASVIAWRSPVSGSLRIEGNVADVHPECGNGVLWALELRRGVSSEVLASGEGKSAAPLSFGPFEKVPVEAGQVLAFVVNPRDGNHSCDLTALNLSISDGTTTWDLGKEVSPDILKGNPHGPWHFLSQPAAAGALPDAPAIISEWRKSPSPALATRVRQHLENDFPLNHPLLAAAMRSFQAKSDSRSLPAAANSVIEIQIPAALRVGSEFVVTGRLASKTGGSVQMQALTEKQEVGPGLVAIQSASGQKPGKWSDNNLVTRYSAPILVNDGGEARERFEAAFAEFRSLFPIALCYSQIVPVDEVVTLTLYHREDEPLRRLFLDEAETAALDHLWDELLFVSEAPLKQIDVFEQLFQYATQDATPSAFEPMREPIMKAAAAFKEQQKSVLAVQGDAVIDFAAEAWRRPLTDTEIAGLRAFPPRLMLVRVMTSPAFLYRGEKPPVKTGPVTPHELATRLSYFLWSSAPDEKLRAAAGSLHDSDVLGAQTRRMLADGKIRRLAAEFGCQWLHVRDVATLDEKSERHFPTFLGLRADMQEEVTRFFIDLFQNNRSVLSLLDADHSFLNESLAKHYEIDWKGEGWQRIEGLHAKNRGGILGFAAILSKQSGASRNSAILRGTWLTEVVLGDKLPKPPRDVPILPDEAPPGLTERQLIERHSSDPSCAGCHQRIDPFGFALEGFDAIGRSRAADTGTTLPDGTAIDGFADLRDYLVTQRQDDFLRQFSRKLLGYALGRSVQLSDRPLIDAMMQVEGREIGAIVDLIVQSPQFRERRGKEFESTD
jgi:hypothetical protein